ncbi:E3 ubiquitin-protein ligase Topors-like [Numida meleagris]|uniref:E3 ubiquitin-protein ligase Topors-like n=1 Tax=Numida meleagris TaxID=8996 RepID=UPI000B3DABAE|nr:E3 ubiquitin-protein ligase Topors-like [Numida meleagris]
MAAEEAWTCPICRDVQKDIAYAVPCRHEFCLGCILRWAKQTETCPLCRRTMAVIKVAAWDDDSDLDFIIRPPAPPVPACFQAGIASIHSPHRHAPSPPPFLLLTEEEEEAVEAEQGRTVGGLLLEVWAALFRQHREILDPVLPWLRQELRVIFGTQWWEAMAAENLILNALCDIGLDSEALIQLLRPALGHRAEMLIQGLVDTIVSRWGEEAHGQLGLQGVHVSGGQEEGPAARGQEDSSVTTPGPTASPQGTLASTPGPNGSAASPNREEQPSTPEAVLPEDPSHPHSNHILREHEEPHEETEQAAAAGPSAQGSSPSALACEGPAAP